MPPNRSKTTSHLIGRASQARSYLSGKGQSSWWRRGGPPSTDTKRPWYELEETKHERPWTGKTVVSSSDNSSTEHSKQEGPDSHAAAFDFLESGRGCSVLAKPDTQQRSTDKDQIQKTDWNEDPNLTALPTIGTSLSKVTTAASRKVDDSKFSEHGDQRFALAREDSDLVRIADLASKGYTESRNANGLVIRTLEFKDFDPASGDSLDDRGSACFGWKAPRWLTSWGSRIGSETRSASKAAKIGSLGARGGSQ